MQGENIALAPFRMGAQYTRTEIAVAGGVKEPKGPRDPYWSTGIVSFDNSVLLFVTLEKELYTYRDYFDGAIFWWQSQQQQSQSSKLLKRLSAGDCPVLLFIRLKAKTPFTYAGGLEFQDMRGSKPVTVKFQSLDYISEGAPSTLQALYTWQADAPIDRIEQARHDEIEERLSRGQGPQSNPKLRRAIEKYAMDRAKEHYSKEGFEVEDTSKNKPYDLVCVRDGAVRRIEVKGTQSRGLKVLVTSGEVRASRDPDFTTDLFVIHSIVAKNVTSEPELSGGQLRLIPGWRAMESHLTATVYRCEVAPSP